MFLFVHIWLHLILSYYLFLPSYFFSLPLVLLISQTAQCLTPPTHSILGGSLSSPRPPRPRKPRDCKPKMRKLKYHQYIPPDQRGNTGGTSGNNSQKNNNTQVQPIDPAYSRLLHQQQVFLQLQILNQQQQLTVATR